MPAFIDLTGQRFGKCVALRYDGFRNKRTFWVCRCDCGTEFTTRANNLRKGWTRSCGCLRKNNRWHTTTHGLSSHPLYRGAYHHMLNRCFNPNDRRYADWGGRGITVCDRWLGPDGFPNFLADMGERPEGRTLDRIDNDGNYEPGNCRWATPSQQMLNRRPMVRNLPRGEAHVGCKISDTDVAEVRRLHALGNFTQDELGKRFGISRSRVGQLVAGDRS